MRAVRSLLLLIKRPFRRVRPEMLLYGLPIGGLGILVFAAMLWAFSSHVHHWFILLFSSLVVYSVAYFVDAVKVFKSDVTVRGYWIYLASVGGNFVITSALMILSVDIFGANPLLARVVVAVGLVPFILALHANHTFADRVKVPAVGQKTGIPE